MRLPLALFIVGVGVVALGATAVQAQETDKKKNPSDPKAASTVLVFKLESNQTYDFRATCEKSGAAGEATERADARLHYRLTPLRDNAGGGYNISVMVDADATTAKKAEKTPSDPKNDADKTKNDADKSKKAEDILGKDREARKTMTVQVDSTGKITSVKGLEDLRSHLRTDGTTAELETLEAVQMHIALILGSGLHGPNLQVGQTYPIGGFGDTATPAGNVPANPTADAVKAEKNKLHAMTSTLQLRFDGISGDLARFSIVNSTAPQTAIGDDKSKPAAANVGTATYSVEDGLVQSIKGQMDSGTAVAPAKGAVSATRFSIDRIGTDAKSEPPR